MMSKKWIRCTLKAELLSDAHPGSGSGGGGIDALIARDRHGRPVIWASHIEGLLRDAALRLEGDAEAERFFGRAGGRRQRAVFTSLYVSAAEQNVSENAKYNAINRQKNAESRIWRSTARKSFDNRAAKDDSLRAIEYVPKSTVFAGEVELPEEELPALQRLVKEVDALGSGRASGSGHVRLSLEKIEINGQAPIKAAAERLIILLKNRDPLCITATATPTNIIPSFAFVPGRTLLGALANWLIADGKSKEAELLTSGKVSVSDALPVPEHPAALDSAEVLPAPLSLQSQKPKGTATDLPWWALPVGPTQRLDAWSAQSDEKLKRPEDDLFVYRPTKSDAWKSFRPIRTVRLRNGRPNPKQSEPSLFAVEQIAEDNFFIAELNGTAQEMQALAFALEPVFGGRRLLRIGRGGAPVEVVDYKFTARSQPAQLPDEALLILSSDLLVRDENLRWLAALDEEALRKLTGIDGLQIVMQGNNIAYAMQESVPVHGFNGTSRLWRMPAAAIRRGSVFRVAGAGLDQLAQRAANGQWLGERTHEGFGRFRLESSLPGVSTGQLQETKIAPRPDDDEETIAKETGDWFSKRKELAQTGAERRPSLSQWIDLVGDLERGKTDAIASRLNPQTAGGKNWKYQKAQEILDKLAKIEPQKQPLYARYFVRWLRAEIRANKQKK
jgi:hypothetical protein